MDRHRSNLDAIPKSAMTDSQKQSAGEGSTAIQAGRDVTINNGVSIAQMSEIITALSAHVERLSATAKELIEDRLSQFRTEIVTRFANDTSTKIEAFSDPDFQASILDAQRAFARSGDSNLQSVLTDLIAQRSKQPARNRITLTLNDAITKAGSIPKADLNALSLMFVLQNVFHTGVVHFDGMIEFLQIFVEPGLHEISTSDSAQQYLTSHGCITTAPPGISYMDLVALLTERYPTAITKGANEEAFRGEFPDFDRLRSLGLIVTSQFDRERFIFRNLGTIDFANFLALPGVYGNHSDQFVKLAKANLPTKEELIEVLGRRFQMAGKLFEVYDTNLVQNSRLTSVGIALAHGNLTKAASNQADLAIWIKD